MRQLVMRVLVVLPMLSAAAGCGDGKSEPSSSSAGVPQGKPQQGSVTDMRKAPPPPK